MHNANYEIEAPKDKFEVVDFEYAIGDGYNLLLKNLRTGEMDWLYYIVGRRNNKYVDYYWISDFNKYVPDGAFTASCRYLVNNDLLKEDW